MSDTSIAHVLDSSAHQFYEGGRAPWLPAKPPNIEAEEYTGHLRGCKFCGSMHPEDLAAAIRAGATVEWADFKYGWPHKVYVYKVPNPHAGMVESRSMSSSEAPGYERVAHPRFNERTGERVEDLVRWVQKGVAGPTTDGKFYTVHLQDATPEDREVIERAMGLRFTFDGRGVGWVPFDAPRDPESAADTQDAA